MREDLIDSFGLSPKSCDYWHKDSPGPLCLRTWTCEQPKNSQYWSPPSHSTSVYRKPRRSLNINNSSSQHSLTQTAFFEFSILACPTQPAPGHDSRGCGSSCYIFHQKKSLFFPLLGSLTASSGQNLRTDIQDGSLQHQLEPSLPLAPPSSTPLLDLGIPVNPAVTQYDPNLPPLPEKLCSKIIKRAYVRKHPSYASSQNNFTLTVNPQDATTLAFVPSQRKKCRIDGISSWLEAWNVYLCSILPQFPQLSTDLLSYQHQICKFHQTSKASTWLMYDTVFCYIMAASNLSIAWGKVNEQLYNDILKEERRRLSPAAPVTATLMAIVLWLALPDQSLFSAFIPS